MTECQFVGSPNVLTGSVREPTACSDTVIKSEGMKTLMQSRPELAQTLMLAILTSVRAMS